MEEEILTENLQVGHLMFDFKSSTYPNDPDRCARVTVNGTTLCWISWDDRYKFVNKLNEVIDRFEK